MKRKGSVFLLLCVVILSSIFAKNTFAGEGLLNNKKYTNHTYIGPFNISNNNTKQAKSKLTSDLSNLQNRLEVNLIYQDTQFSLPSETIKFDIDMTLANANSGEDNLIIAAVSREGLQTVFSQELPKIQFSEDAIDSVATGIEKELQTGIMPRNVHITDYLGIDDMQVEVLASSEYRIEGISPALSKAIHALDQSVIGPFESFSMLDVLSSSEVGALTDEEMTLLSSILYTATLQTNLQIDERNISATITTDIQPGFEAAMNQTLGLDFKFSNPNKTEFTIRAAWSAGVIHLSIEGKPFYYSYEPSILKVETYKQRTIRQYSAFVNKGQVVVSQEGKEGVEAIVKRTLSVGEKVVGTEDISEDFYAPIHRIEIHSLVKEPSSTTNLPDDQGVGQENNDNSYEQNPPGDFSDNNNSTQGTDQNQSSGNEYNSTENDDDQDSSSSTGGTPDKSGQLEYDKSGLPITGK